MSKRTKLAALGTAGVGLLAAIVLWLFWPRAVEPAHQPSPTQAAARAPRTEVKRTTAPVAAPTKPKPVPPVIDSITVEKSRVCEGEDNLVSVQAHVPGREGVQPRVVVGTNAGTRVPLRAWLDGNGQAPEVQVSAYGADGSVVRKPVPAYTVMACPPHLRLAVGARGIPNSLYTYELATRIVVPKKKDGTASNAPRVVGYSWDFGDGAKHPGAAELTHDFEDAAASSEFNYALVTVEAELEDGSKLTGRTSVELVNPARHFAEQGLTLLVAKLTPRFPEVSEDGSVRQTVRLRHYDDETVTVTAVRRVTAYGSNGSPGERTEDIGSSPAEPVDASSILGTTSIPPGRGIEFPVVLDAELVPDTAFLTYEVEGETSSGRPARGTFSIMRPPPAPTAQNSIPVDSPVLQAKIQRAMELLGQSSVSFSDLQRLDREGAFKELSVPSDDEPVVAAAGPPQRD